MFSTVIAWIGISMIAIWTISYIVGLFLIFSQYRLIEIENKTPSKMLTFTSCSVVFVGLVSLVLYIPLLIADFKIEVLLTMLAIAVIVAIELILRKKAKKEGPEDEEKMAQVIENAPVKLRALSLIPVFLTTVLRIAPFVVYLMVK